MSLQKVFTPTYTQYLRANIKVENYLGERFPYDQTQVRKLSGVRHHENLLSEMEPSPEGNLKSAIAIYEAYEHISPLFAQQDSLWIYLAHVDLFDYVKKRWPLKDIEEEKLIGHIQEHWLETQAIRSTLSGLWRSVYLTVDDDRPNRYELTAVLFKNETFRTRVFGGSLVARHKAATQGILEYMLENMEKFKPLEQKGQDVAKYFNMLGSYKLLPSLPKDYFKKEMDKLTANW